LKIANFPNSDYEYHVTQNRTGLTIWTSIHSPSFIKTQQNSGRTCMDGTDIWRCRARLLLRSDEL